MTTEPRPSRRSAPPSRGATPQLRGAVIVGAIQTIRELWGEDVHRAALAKLDPHEQELLSGELLATGFYPIATWDRFLSFTYDEVALRTGETVEQFYARLVRLGGSRMLRVFYKVFLGLMRPTTVARLIPGFWTRLYTSGEMELSVNEPGRCVLVFTDDSPAFRFNVVHHVPPGTVLLLSENGAKGVQSRLTRDELVDGKLLVEVTTTYEA